MDDDLNTDGVSSDDDIPIVQTLPVATTQSTKKKKVKKLWSYETVMEPTEARSKYWDSPAPILSLDWLQIYGKNKDGYLTCYIGRVYLTRRSNPVRTRVGPITIANNCTLRRFKKQKTIQNMIPVVVTI
jgi:hypothetical protein